jgi:hypothetical protein
VLEGIDTSNTFSFSFLLLISEINKKIKAAAPQRRRGIKMRLSFPLVAGAVV